MAQLQKANFCAIFKFICLCLIKNQYKQAGYANIIYVNFDLRLNLFYHLKRHL